MYRNINTDAMRNIVMVICLLMLHVSKLVFYAQSTGTVISGQVDAT